MEAKAMIPETKSFGLLLALASAALMAAAPCAEAQTLKIVHDFTGGHDGANPDDGLVMGPTGLLYGTASAGGDAGLGVVYRLNAKGGETVLHSFAGGADGATPNGGLILDSSGTLLGTTAAGGASGAGTVFRVKDGKEAVLYSFAGGSADGASPQAELTMDEAGNLYGTTSAGGKAGNGTVFELVAPKKKNGKWKEVVLYSFGAGSDGAVPLSGVTFDAAGNLYGTTSVGGANGYGTIFQLKPGAAWTEQILHSFQNGNDGAYPYAGFVADTAGNLYGAATQGGANGGGTIFALKPSKGGGLKFSVLYSVPGWDISGSFRNLLLDETGTLYGTTHCDGDDSAGTIFKLAPTHGGGWAYTLLYTFTGGSDGQFTISNLVLKGGKLYGTTIGGGADGAGVVYTLTP